MNDKELLEMALTYGRNALLWRQKFIGLLPEIYKRRLFEQKGCSSIFEFAAKFCGLSNDQVRLTLKLEERFTEMPRLHEQLVTGEVSINKLARIASIATKENEVELSEIVQNMSQKAVETLVRDEKFTGMRAQTLSLNDEVRSRLVELQEKGIDVNELISAALNKREEEIAEEKAQPVETAKSRPVPAKTERLLTKEHGTKCSIPTCYKPSEVIHHTQTFALSHRHDPNYLAPLCKEHHEIAHAINLKVREKRKYVA
ncbi:MAG: hypothetical protein AAB836_00235 [Patescibacteria group bacterium]